jgi:predicted nucleic acid-binding protein
LNGANASTITRQLDQASGRGGNPGFEDAAIAATAFRANLTAVTGKIRHFQRMDVAVIDPFDALPAL